MLPSETIYNTTSFLLPCPFPLLQPPALMGSAMAMRVEWIVVVLAVLPAQLAATALLVAIAPVSAAVPQAKLVWQVRQAGMCAVQGFWYKQLWYCGDECPGGLNCMDEVCISKGSLCKPYGLRCKPCGSLCKPCALLCKLTGALCKLSGPLCKPCE
jgi:hypothetical protein